MGLGLVCGLPGVGSEGEWMREDEDHVCEDGDGAVLLN